MQQLRAAFQLDQGRHRLPVAASAREQRDVDAIDPAVAAKGQQSIDGAAFKRAIQAIARLEGKAGRFMAMPGAGAHPAFAGDDHRDGLIDNFDLRHSFFLGLDQGAARVFGRIAISFGIRFDFLDHQAAQRSGRAQNVFELALLLAQLLQLLLNFDGFQPRQLTQADFKNVFGLPVAQGKARDQRCLGLIALADDGDHFVNIEQNDLAAFEDVDPLQHLVQPVARAPLNRGGAKLDPFQQQLAQALERGAAI